MIVRQSENGMSISAASRNLTDKNVRGSCKLRLDVVDVKSLTPSFHNSFTPYAELLRAKAYIG